MKTGSLFPSYRKILSLHHNYSALAQCSNVLCNMKMDLTRMEKIIFSIINQAALKNRLLKMSSFDYVGENINGKITVLRVVYVLMM